MVRPIIRQREGDEIYAWLCLQTSIPFRCSHEETAIDVQRRAPMACCHVLRSSAAHSKHFDTLCQPRARQAPANAILDHFDELHHSRQGPWR